MRGLPLVDEFPLIINVTHFWCRSDIVQLCNPSHKYLPTFAFLEKVKDIVTKLYKYSSHCVVRVMLLTNCVLQLFSLAYIPGKVLLCYRKSHSSRVVGEWGVVV